MEKEHVCQNFHMSIQIVCEYLTFFKFMIFIRGIRRIFTLKFSCFYCAKYEYTIFLFSLSYSFVIEFYMAYYPKCLISHKLYPSLTTMFQLLDVIYM